MQCGSIAAVTYVFAEYATQFVRLPEFSAGVAAWSLHVPFIGDVSPLKEIGTKGLAAALIVLLTAINYVGVRFGGLVQNIFTIAKVAAMLLLVLGAFLLPTGGAAANLTTPSATIHLSGLALVAGHRRRAPGRLLGLRRLEQAHLHRRRSEAAAAQHPARPALGHAHRHRHLSADERRLRLCAAH